MGLFDGISFLFSAAFPVSVFISSSPSRLSVFIFGPAARSRWFKSNPRHQETNKGRIALRSILPSSFLLPYLRVLEYHCAIALSVVLRHCVVVV